MLDNVLELAREEEGYVVGMRRHFHAHPELGWQEQATADRVCRELEAIDVPFERVCGTGVVATICGRQARPVLGLRADMDALPVGEENDLPFRSVNPGVMHACGHDAHTAMLLGAARILARHRADLACTVRLVFQPAEELIQGAHRMVVLPQLQDLDNIVALHVNPGIATGHFSVEAGERLASADTINIVIHGRGGHGAMPHRTIDPIMAGCSVVANLQTITSREMDPVEPVVISICSFHGGTSSNVIADSATLCGTVRTFSPAIRKRLPEIVERVVGHSCAALRAGYDFEFVEGTPPTINEEQSSARAARAVKTLFGEDALVPLSRHTSGEDFAWFLERISGCLVALGCRNEAKQACCGLHTPWFRLDEDALVHGTAFLVQYVLETQQALLPTQPAGR